MIRGRTVQRTVHRVPAEEEVQVVLERDTDPAVELHAVLQQLGAIRTDERLCHAHELWRVGRPRSNRRRCGVADGVAGLQP